MTIATVNETGKREIADWLLRFAKNPQVGQAELDAWAAEAEASMRECNGPEVELSMHQAIDGCTRTLTISPGGLS